MTVSEYAEACGNIVERLEESGDIFDSSGDFSSGFDVIDDALSDLKKLNPPQELDRVHTVVVETLQFTSTEFKDVGLFDLMEDMAEMEKDTEELSESEAMKRMADFEERMESVVAEMERLGPEIDRLESELEEAASELSPATRDILDAGRCDWL